MTLVVKLLNFISHKKKLFNYLISLLVIFFISSLLLSCEKKLLHNFSGEIMGTSYKVLISDPLPSSVNQEVIFNILDSVNQEMSTYIPSSFLNKLNNTKVYEWLSASKDFLQVITYAKSACILSKGAFDVSIGGIVNSQGFGSAKELDWPLDKVDYKIEEIGCESIEINNTASSVRRVKDVYIDLSAIAKGYAVDKLSKYLNSKKLFNFLIEIGGEIIVSGNKRDSLWEVGIENPFSLSKPIFILDSRKLGNFSLATSGIYRNFRYIDGQRISHTFDPRSGKSIDSALLSVTVLSNTAMEADVLATTLNVLGLNHGLEFAEINDIKAVFIFQENNSLNYKTSSQLNRVLH
jgi:thiamine biosynthesis lipoprotein